MELIKHKKAMLQCHKVYAAVDLSSTHEITLFPIVLKSEQGVLYRNVMPAQHLLNLTCTSSQELNCKRIQGPYMVVTEPKNHA